MLNHAHLACATQGCHATITVHDQEEARLRRTGETFYCPAGHSNIFRRGKSEKDKRIEQLEKQNGWLHDELRDSHDARNELREALIRGVQVCPYGCGWHGTRQLRWVIDEESLGRFYDRVYTDLCAHLEIVHAATPGGVNGSLRRLAGRGEQERKDPNSPSPPSDPSDSQVGA